MAMFECHQCGAEESNFPGVFLAVNSPIKPYPNHHDNVWEQKFNEFSRRLKEPEHRWEAFYNWLCGQNTEREGNSKNTLKWFCSKKCAMEYLLKEMEVVVQFIEK